MKTDSRNYGIQHDYGPRLEASRAGVMSVGGERTWSVLAHLSTFLNLFTGFLGPVAAFVIWLVYKDDSPTVARHALRSIFYQVAWLTAIFIGWTVTFALMAILVGFLLVPIMAVVTLAPFVQASYEAYMAYRGGSRRYY
ncbi:MAG TPA: DUF4870 domain-containing protein [Rubrobacter sp.]|jgi:uncharacterized Tic20 family protein|nr:DUF4870 domain-containing protein [Rubrobacter sp.]